MLQQIEKHIIKSSTPLVKISSIRSFLMDETEKAIGRFPHFLDHRLYKGLERLLVNAPNDFLIGRSFHHLRILLLTQFFLQKKMEKALLVEEQTSRGHFFLKIFGVPSHICVALASHISYGCHRERILKALYTVLPGIQEIPLSSYTWHHSEFPYLFSYLEVRKLRGDELSRKELRNIEKSLEDQLLAIPPLTPALFWPYNEEESYRQIQLLRKEVSSKEDLPHISIHFQEQTRSHLEFLIHLVKPTSSEALEETLKRLPNFLHYFCRFYHLSKNPFPIELAAFSLKIPSTAFEVNDSINLLYARRYVLRYLEELFGVFRDYNGGLFEKQQQHFEALRIHLSDKIPHFDLFAEKLFYALHPVETRFSLSLKDAEELFFAFSQISQEKQAFVIKNPSPNVLVAKAAKSLDLLKLSRLNTTKPTSQAQLSFGNSHYLCLLKPQFTEIEPLLHDHIAKQERTKVLRLAFEEGVPLSLNPYHSSGDMRCRLLSKLLFEGLTRLDKQGKPALAGALAVDILKEGSLYIFKLRPYRWSNGERVTAVDYVISWQCALREYVSHPELLFVIKNGRKFKEKQCDAKMLGIQALDTETLQIELEWPDPYFLHKLAQPFFFPLFGSMREPKWFNGPYLIRNHTKEGILLERNPYFWDSKRPYFEQIEFKWMDDLEGIYNLFLEGKVDWIGDPLSTLSLPIIKQLQEEKKLKELDVSRRFLVCFNTKHSPLSSSFIRRALSLAIDRALVCNTIFPHSVPLSPSKPLAEEANILFEKGLQELGLTRQTFPILTFSYSHQTRREKLALCLQSGWEKTLGTTIRLERIEWNFFRNKLEKGSFEISGTIQDTLDADSIEFLEKFEGTSSWNFSQWSHPEYRALIALAKKEHNKLKQKRLLSSAKKILVEEAPFTPLFRYMHLYAHHPQLEEYLFDKEGCIDFSFSFFKNSNHLN